MARMEVKEYTGRNRFLVKRAEQGMRIERWTGRRCFDENDDSFAVKIVKMLHRSDAASKMKIRAPYVLDNSA